MSSLFEQIMLPINALMTGTKSFYEMLYSIPIIDILQENVAVIGVSLYLYWYIKAYLSRTELVVQEGSIMHKIADRIASVHTGYRPTIWCYWASINTVVFALIQRIIKHDYFREVLKTPDGGLIAIDWANFKSSDKKMIVLVLPGLTGSSKENYVTHLVDKAVKQGCKAVVMNYRGIEVELKTSRTYCATNYDDLDMVVNHIHDKFKDHKIFAVGISLGGIKLGGYLAKQYDDCIISNAMIVSAPLNINVSCHNMEKPHYMYTFNRFLARQLKKYITKHMHYWKNDENYDFDAISKAYTLKKIDSLFVCKNFSYASVNDYYNEACLDAKIKNIKTPTLFLNAGDDMFSPEEAFPIEQVKANPYTALVCTKYGGHIAFCEGLLPTGCNYTCRLLTEYLEIVLNDIEQIPTCSQNTGSDIFVEENSPIQSDATPTPLFTLN